MKSLESRVSELEIQLAHMIRIIEQLNEIVTEQTLSEDRQRRVIRTLISQIEELKQKPSGTDDPFDERPPHY